jgi:hypothetical protein
MVEVVHALAIWVLKEQFRSIPTRTPTRRILAVLLLVQTTAAQFMETELHAHAMHGTAASLCLNPAQMISLVNVQQCHVQRIAVELLKFVSVM